MHELNISHKQHPARRERLTGLSSIKYCLAANKSLAIGTSNVGALYDKIKFEYPDAKISKHDGYVLVEAGK